MSKYAARTSVPVSRSGDEIRKTLEKYGATQFGVMQSQTHAMIAFLINGKAVKLTCPLPLKNVTKTQEQHEQNLRQRWRALALGVKSKLESVSSGISTLEQEFLPYLVLPNGKTYGEHALPQLQEAYKSGKMPLLLTGL